MRSFVAAVIALAFLAVSPVTSAAFSDGFKKTMTDVQTKIMLNNQKFTPADVKAWWNAYDKEVIALLSGYAGEKKLMQEELNKQTVPVELMVTERKGTEVEDIELGKVSAQLYQIDGKTWLAVLNNKMHAGSTPLPFSTVRFYQQSDGTYQRVAALDEVDGPWDKDKIQFGTVQYQPMGKKKGALQFATFHIWPVKSGDKPNRSQIIWQYKDQPKAVLIVPEVDWHKNADGTIAEGHGEAYDVP